jgi:CheY-like chemotaxis protein
MTTSQPMSREVTFVIVDDDDVDAIGIERALKKLKILNPIARAHDGIEALEMLRHPSHIQRPYLILLDINMPRMNGLEMLSELRNDPQLSSAIVFMMTTSKTDEDKIAAYRHHVAGYIYKYHIGDGFLGIVDMLDHFWRVIEFPIEN